MRIKPLSIGLSLAAACISWTPAARADDPPPFDNQVTDSIRRAVDYLLTHKNPQGVWEGNVGCQWANISGGQTALVIDALIDARHVLDDERLKPSASALQSPVAYLSQIVPESTYAASYQAVAFAHLPDTNENHAVLRNAAKTLKAFMHNDGSFGYSNLTDKLHEPPPSRIFWDNSNSQAAVLGLWSAADAGVEISTSYWKRVDGHWRARQAKNGGWYYFQDRGGGTASEGWGATTNAISSAGLASLYVAREQVDTEAPLDTRPDRAIDAGLAYVTAHIAEFSRDPIDLYALYALERVGLASGLKYLGQTDWYHNGAAYVMSKQKPDGSWDSGVQHCLNPAVTTAMAISFLARGQGAVAFNKLAYKGPWNARHMDDLNLTHYLAKSFETNVNWQVVGADVPVAGWFDAPILLITGHGDPAFPPDLVAKFKAFTDAGGLIFSTADGSDKKFTQAVEACAAAMTGGAAQMRELPLTHPVYHAPLEVLKPIKLESISNGVRELWVHSPIDMGGDWQRKAFATPAAFQEPANLYFYWSGGQPPQHNDRLTPPDAGTAGATLHLARIKYAGNWDPEPAAWVRESGRASKTFDAKIETTATDAAGLDVTQTPIAHLTGTAALTLPPADEAKIKAYVDGGGLLLADAAGGSPDFAESFIKLVQRLYPGAGLESIPAADPLYTSATGGAAAIERVSYRRAFTKKYGAAKEPRLLGLKHNGRWGIVFSPDDLTGGLAGVNASTVVGPTAESAQALVRNVLVTARNK